MPDSYVTVREHEEFVRTMESENQRLREEDDRQNHRIKILEENMEQLRSLALSVNKLATNMEHMINEQLSQGRRLEKLEDRDGDSWRKFKWLFIGGVVTIILSFLAFQIGLKV